MTLRLSTALLVAGLLTYSGDAESRQHLPDSEESGCLACHQGLEPIRQPDSEMMRQIMAMGRGLGDPAGCVVCHGGDATATGQEGAHRGGNFYADPGSPWINEHTCGPCHLDHTGAQWNSLMMTEAGKIQGTTWAFGSLEGYEHK